MSLRMGLTLAVFAVLLVGFGSCGGYGRMVGGRMEVKDVRSNEEVQELGRFSVEEYNRINIYGDHHDHNIINYINDQTREDDDRIDGTELKFREVVEAERQVVSGIKYYLKITALSGDGVTRMLDSVVVVKPWVPSRQVVSFGSIIQQLN